jgi:adenylate cyclase
MTQEFYFDWHWDLESSPQEIWPFASDTNRFNRDTGQPEIELLENVKGVKQARMKLPIRVEWEEEPFEWTYPYSFGILRTYRKGPIDEMRVKANFDPRPEAGTHVRYQTWMKTDNLLVQLALPVVIGVIARNRFEKAFRLYDRIAGRRGKAIEIALPRSLSAAGRARFQTLSQAIRRQGTDASLLTHLEDFWIAQMNCRSSAFDRTLSPTAGKSVDARYWRCSCVRRR